MKTLRVVLFSITLLLIPALVSAQDATARVAGTITDPTGAVIPGVQVTVTSTATQVSRKVDTNHDGYYQVLALPIGNYRVTAEHAGFRTVVSDEYKLLINQALRVDIKMEVGAASQTVEVGAQAAPVETVNATLGQSVTGRNSPICRSTAATCSTWRCFSPALPRATTTTAEPGTSALPAAEAILSPTCSTAGKITIC